MTSAWKSLRVAPRVMSAGKAGNLGQAELPIHLLQIPACLGLWALTVQGEHMVHLLPGAQG